MPWLAALFPGQAGAQLSLSSALTMACRGVKTHRCRTAVFASSQGLSASGSSRLCCHDRLQRLLPPLPCTRTSLPLPHRGAPNLAPGPRGSVTRTPALSRPVASSHVRNSTHWDHMASSEGPYKPEGVGKFILAVRAQFSLALTSTWKTPHPPPRVSVKPPGTGQCELIS